MNFHGTARRLGPTDFQEVATFLGVTEAHIRTVCEVETSGHGFITDGRPAILFERHRFYSELKNDKTKLTRAVKAGLAYPKWGTRPYPKGDVAVWNEFMRACDIDEHAAIRSTSWGLGQVMGDEFDEAGYSSPEEMVASFCESELNQLLGMAKLIRKRGLDRDLLRFPDMDACRHFALRYNGSGYAKNNYHNKLATAYRKWAARLKAGPIVDDGVLRVGSKGERVRALQEALAKRGYNVRPDGDFGNRTRDAVLAWKADNDLELAPEVTAEQFDLLERSPDRPVSEERTEATAKDLKGESRIVASSVNAENVLKGTGLIVGGTTAADQVGLLDQAQAIADKGEQAKGLFSTIKSVLGESGLSTIMHFIVVNKVWFILAALVAVFLYLRHIRNARVEMHNNGETV